MKGRIHVNLPTIGTELKTPDSRYQVMLVDKTNKSISPIHYIRINRYFDVIEERDEFVKLFEASILNLGGKLTHNQHGSHPLFLTFNIHDNKGISMYELVVYM